MSTMSSSSTEVGKEFPFPTAASSAIHIGGRLGQACVEIGASVGGAIQHVVMQLPLPVSFSDDQIQRWKLPPSPPPILEGTVRLSVERVC
jgi:hypothetical protein